MFLFLTFHISLFFPQYFRFSRALRSFSPVKNRLRKHAHASRARNKCCESIFSFVLNRSRYFSPGNVSLCTYYIILYRENIKNQSSRYFSLGLIFHFSNIPQKLKNNFQISTPSSIIFHFHFISNFDVLRVKQKYIYIFVNVKTLESLTVACIKDDIDSTLCTYDLFLSIKSNGTYR